MRSPEFKVGPKSNYSVHASQLLQLWTVAHKAALSMGFPRQEYWSGLPFLTPGDLLAPGTEPASPALAGRFFITIPPGKPHPKEYLDPK